MPDIFTLLPKQIQQFRTFLLMFKIVVFCFIDSTLHAQPDTNFTQSYYRKIIPRVLYNYKTQDIYFTNKKDKNNISRTAFSTGNQFQVGFNFSYKWVNVGYNVSLSPGQSKHNMDFRVATAYKPFQVQFNVTSLQNLNYTLTKGSSVNRQDTILSQRENNVSIVTSKLKADYVFNYRRYSYSAGFTQAGWQLKSNGSFIASAALSNDNILLDHLSELAKMQFDSINKFTTTKINEIDLGIGYGYNWIIGKHWTFSIVEIPKMGLELIKSNTLNNGNYYFTVGFVNHFKGGIVYARKHFFTGLSAYNLISSSKLKSGNYSNVYNSVDIYVGWIFNEKRKTLAAKK